jgi:2-keto-4-pentenoate hydratase/2-oxohepta-3-ene-1,7-dioic acid hydratase in catechol pathway
MINIYCIGRNFAKHVAELGNPSASKPIVFLKTASSLRSFQSGLTAFKEEVFHHEAELVLKIGLNHDLNQQYQPESIESIAFGIDLTRRARQNELKASQHPWTESKSFLGSGLVGQFHPFSIFSELKSIRFKFELNGHVKQQGDTDSMLFNFKHIVEYINQFSPLKAGDLIFTGTPEGVGEIKHGDQFQFSFPQLGITEKGTL